MILNFVQKNKQARLNRKMLKEKRNRSLSFNKIVLYWGIGKQF